MKNQVLKSIVVTGLLLGCCFVQAIDYTPAVQDAFTPLPPGAIQLTGVLENDIQNSIEHWNKGVVPYAKMVEFFRSGRTQFALGEMWGKAVRSGCMFYRYTHDPELKKILDTTVADLLTTQRENGSISCVPVAEQPNGPEGDMWERKYVMLGLDEYYQYVEQDPKVLEAMQKQADCIIAQIGDAPKKPLVELGWSPNHIESATLMEPFMRLYKHTGEKRYLEFAEYIIKTGGSMGYNIIQQNYEDELPYKIGGPYPKAYEMTSLFEGLAEYYRLTGDEYIQTAIFNLYKNVHNNELTILGNAGGDQPHHPQVYGEAWDNTKFEQTNPNMKRMMETCVGVTWMKYCSQLLRLSGETSMADDIEQYIYNGLIGAMKPTGDGFSYVNLLNGEKVTNVGWGTTFDGLPVTCCNLNGPMGLAYIPYVAVMNSQNGPVVNLYNPAKVKMQTPDGKNLELTLTGDYPLEEQVQITVNPEQAENFALNLRIPSWSEKTIVRVNGKRQKVAVGNYAKIERMWKPGDEVEINFDFQAKLIDAPRGSNPAGYNYQAVIWGPIVLARDENTDPFYNQPVKVIADKKGCVKVRREVPTLKGTRLEFSVPTTTGDIRMIDYASVNGWQGKRVCTWLPIKYTK